MTGYGDHIMSASRKWQVSPELLAAIIQVESGGRQGAFRYEPAFYNKYIRNKKLEKLPGYVPTEVTPTSEKLLRSSSFGLMQIMGQTARENGFEREDLCDLIIHPDLNINLGAKIIAKHLSNTVDVKDALLRYNGGGDPDYPDRVLDCMEDGEAQHLLT